MDKQDQTKNLEIELKLVGDPAGLETAWNAPELDSRRTGPVRTSNLVARYYDTPDFDLRRRGIGLRVRTDGEEIVQTLKAAVPNGNGLRRREWNAKLTELSIDLDAFKDKTEVDGLNKLNRLAPIFETNVSRQIAILDRPGDHSSTIVEAAFDRGEIKAERSAVPLAEIELELREGNAAAIFDLALELSKIAPLRVETRSKWSRGWDLVTGSRPAWCKANTVNLDSAMSVDEAFGTVLGSCFEQWLANQAAAIDGGHPEGVHQLRVALRRLRSALAIFGKAIDKQAIEWIKTEARWVLQSVGPARDLDVFLEELITPVADARPGDQGVAALTDAAISARDRAYEDAREALTSQRYTTFLLRFGAWLERHGWRAGAAAQLDKPIAGYAQKWLGRTHRRTLVAGKRFEELSPEARHEIRLSLKKLRYASEFFAKLYPKKKNRRYVARLRGLQDGLGHLNDLATAEMLVEHVLTQNKRRGAIVGKMRYGAGLLVGWYAHHTQAALQKATADWDGFVAATPYWE